MPALSRLLLLLAFLFGSTLACEREHGPEAPVHSSLEAEAREPLPSPPAGLAGGLTAGRYKGRSTCLELFANGDLHLNDISSGPKVQVLARAQLTQDSEGEVQASIEVERIWKARWTSACRKNHELGGWIEEATILGHRFVVGAHALRLRVISETSIELCAASCELLEREPSLLHGRWRVTPLEDATSAITNPAGEVLDLDADAHGGVWISLGPGDAWAMLSGPMELRHEGDDRFRVRLEVDMVDTGQGVMAEPDSMWRPGARVELSVERLPGERLRVCRGEDGAGACTQLERMFDAFSHDVD